MVTPEAKRKTVTHACCEHGINQRRACDILQVGRSSVRYQSKCSDDSDLRAAIRKVAIEHRRFGYRRIQVMLERDGIFVNHKKLLRIYGEENLQVKRRGG